MPSCGIEPRCELRGKTSGRWDLAGERPCNRVPLRISALKYHVHWNPTRLTFIYCFTEKRNFSKSLNGYYISYECNTNDSLGKKNHIAFNPTNEMPNIRKNIFKILIVQKSYGETSNQRGRKTCVIYA